MMEEQIKNLPSWIKSLIEQPEQVANKTFTYKGLTIIIRKQASPGYVRQKELRDRRKAEGKCVICGDIVNEYHKNGTRFSKCLKCRQSY